MKLKQVTFYTANPDLLYQFYKNILQMNVEMSAGGLTIHLSNSTVKFEPSKNDDQPYYHFAFLVPYRLLDQAKIWLQQRVELLWFDDYKSYIAEFVNWKARSVYFIDPAGNIVECIGRADEDDTTTERFTAAQITDINEVGIVYPEADYEQAVSGLIKNYSLNFFERQPPQKHFKAVGNDHGLLICVPEGRNWYPTIDRPSRIFPFSLEAELNGQIIKLGHS